MEHANWSDSSVFANDCTSVLKTCDKREQKSLLITSCGVKLCDMQSGVRTFSQTVLISAAGTPFSSGDTIKMNLPRSTQCGATAPSDMTGFQERVLGRSRTNRHRHRDATRECEIQWLVEVQCPAHNSNANAFELKERYLDHIKKPKPKVQGCLAREH